MNLTFVLHRELQPCACASCSMAVAQVCQVHLFITVQGCAHTTIQHHLTALAHSFLVHVPSVAAAVVHSLRHTFSSACSCSTDSAAGSAFVRSARRAASTSRSLRLVAAVAAGSGTASTLA